ncbi:hypothetical protein P7K49_009217 [Saguinus oedipus]|uniref:C2H2-type domain-containing protein n=1 Tax=Saguinus oedipus TaxID=9490 RepID=A0ABQ9VJC9_SAGOE|nr:hypothetical protein P7K49_009217 [Saguinus oedipus]
MVDLRVQTRHTPSGISSRACEQVLDEHSVSDLWKMCGSSDLLGWRLWAVDVTIVILSERPFMCETCGKSFASKEYLKHHNRIHTGSKPFKCEVCFRTFAQRNSLYQHIKVHTGERPYCCDQCGKQFTQLNALQRHRRIHTGERPFMCNACGRTFTDKSTLRRHTSIHDKNTPWKSFLVIVDGSPKNDDGHKIEQPDEEFVPSKLSDKLLSFAENGHFHNLATVQGTVPTMQDSSADTACKSDATVVSQDTLLATTISELSELTPQTDSVPTQLPSLSNME